MEDRNARNGLPARLIGLVFSGFMTKLYAGVVAVWIASHACEFVMDVFHPVNAVLGR